MRHRVAGRRLKRDTGQRKALFRNLMSELIRHERIRTTEGKARAVRGQVEKIITVAKRGDLHARRQAVRLVSDPDLINKLFDEIAPRFEDRPGGYTRMMKLGPRKGDAASMVILELVE